VSDDAARVAELLGVLPEVPPLVHGPEPATPSSRPGAVAVGRCPVVVPGRRGRIRSGHGPDSGPRRSRLSCCDANGA